MRIIELQSQTSGSVMCAITGVAGCGKSELAKAYALGSGREFYWRLDPNFSGNQNSAVQVSYEQAYGQLLHNWGIQVIKAFETESLEQMQERLNRMLWRKIDQFGRWILIFDNAGSYKDIKEYLPPDDLRASGSGLILITTQQRLFLHLNQLANFDRANLGLQPQQAVELLRQFSSRAEEDPAATQELVKQLDYSPLAIRVAASYIYNVENISFEEYTRQVKKGAEEELLQLADSENLVSQATGDKKRTATLYAALKLTIKAVTPRLFQVLQYCGYLAHEHIPIDLLSELCRSSDEKVIDVRLKLAAMLVGKNNYSLLTYDSETQSCYIHRTTQAILRDLTFSQPEVIKRILAIMLQLYPYDYHSMEQLKSSHKVESHLLALSQYIGWNSGAASTIVTQRLQLLLLLGQLGFKFSHYSQTISCLEEACEIAKSPDTNQEVIIEILRYLARTRSYLVGPKEARAPAESALEIAKNIYEPIDWRLARIYNDLGGILELDPDASSEEILHSYSRAVEICKEATSRNSSSELGLSYCGIGEYWRKKGEYLQARDYFNRALNLYQRYFDDSHLAVSMCYRHLGTLGVYPNEQYFTNVGIEYIESRKYLDKALLIDLQIFGEKSHGVADSYHCLSRLLYLSDKKEDWELALEYRDKAIESYCQVFGSTSLGLIPSYYWKGQILEKLSRYSEARDSYREALELGQDPLACQIDWTQTDQDTLEQVKGKLRLLSRLTHHPK